MAVNGFVMRIQGIVSYSDGSSGPFSAAISHNDVVTNPFSAASLENFAEFNEDDNANLLALLALFPGTLTLSPAAPAGSKTVTDVVAFISGTVTEDDNTENSFAVELINGTARSIQDPTTGWSLITGDATQLATAQAVWEVLAGVGNTTISA